MPEVTIANLLNSGRLGRYKRRDRGQGLLHAESEGFISGIALHMGVPKIMRASRSHRRHSWCACGHRRRCKVRATEQLLFSHGGYLLTPAPKE